MDKQFDKFLDNLSEPFVDAPTWHPPESVPMEKTVLVDLASEVENKKTYLEEGSDAREARKAEGLLAPPLDVYEPGFRSDLVEAITAYWKDKRRVRENNARIRSITGIGRTV